MEESLMEQISQILHLKRTDPKAYSPLGLAYIGDVVFELIIRTKVISMGNMSVGKYHKRSSSIVNAASQAQMFQKISGELTEEEMAVYKRGRNAKSATTAKNASVVDYRIATGLEALIGYLYLKGEMERAAALIGMGLSEGEK